MKKLISSLAAILALGTANLSHADWLTDVIGDRKKPQANSMVKVKGDEATKSSIASQRALYACWGEVVEESMEYKTELERGRANGAISPTEEANIKKLDAEMEKTIADAKKDGLNLAECQTIHRKIANQKAAVAKMSVYRCDPQMSCFGEITRARNRFLAGVKRGVAEKLLDANELASLKKSHDELVEMESKIFADGKISQKECEAVQSKIIDEEKRLKMALMKSVAAIDPAPAGTTTPAPANTAAQGAASVEWVKGVQQNSLAAGDPIQGKPVRICRLPMPDKFLHPGAEFDGNCYVGFGGKAIKQPVTETLAIKGQAVWVAASANNIPANAPSAGVANGVTMHFCRAKADAGLVPGKEYRGTCYIPSGDKEVKVAQYEVLTLK